MSRYLGELFGFPVYMEPNPEPAQHIVFIRDALGYIKDLHQRAYFREGIFREHRDLCFRARLQFKDNKDDS